MKRHRALSGIIPLLFLLWLPASAGAAELSLDGYYRLRLLLFEDLSPWEAAGQAGDTPTQGLWMHRARLQPELTLSDHVSFHMVMNLLDNTVAGDVPELSRRGGVTVPEFFSQSVEANPDYRKNFEVERVWGQVHLPQVGMLRFGRMGSHWGLGILANDGNAPGDDFGDTVDRVMFITRIGPVYIIPAVDKISETAFFASGEIAPGFFEDPSSVGGQTDDVDQYILAVRYAGEITSGGVYGVYRQQPATDSFAYILDLWGRTRLGPVNLEAEALYLQGETTSFLPTVPGVPSRFRADQWGVAVESDMPWQQFLFGLDFGAASGDDDQGPRNGTINQFNFDRNYRIALLMFHYLPPARDLSPAIGNAWYVRPWARYSVWEDLEFDLVLAHAQALQGAPAFDAAGAYGTEVDLTWRWKVYEDFEWTLTYGALFPGTVYDQAEPGVEPETLVHGVQGRFLVRF